MSHLISLFLLLSIGSCGRAKAPLIVPVAVPSQPCTVAGVPNGSRISCPDGTSQTILDGTAGAPGSTIDTIQLCPDYTPTYPTVFPEYALRIDGKLYAVYYSVPGGTFLSYLPPGAYSSTSNSAMCTFTVNQDGTVQ